MKLLESFKRLDVKDLYVGEIFAPQAFMLDENGKNNGLTKAISLERFDVATKDSEGDFVSVVDGTVYSEGSEEKIKEGKANEKNFFWNVESFEKLTGKKGKISKKAVVAEIEAINAERKQNLGL